MIEDKISVRKVLVVHSPRSGRSAQLTRALNVFQTSGIEVADVLPIAALDNLPPQGALWREQGVDCVVAAGGDGLVGGVVGHVAASGLPLGILPLGTGNDLARAVGIPIDVERAAMVIGLGRLQRIDIGLAQPAEQAPVPTSADGTKDLSQIPTSQSMYFAHALTIGLNVQFARTATQAHIRQQYGALTYPYAVYQAFRSYQPVHTSIELQGLVRHNGTTHATSDTFSLQCRAAQISVINAPVFWGRLQARVPGVSLYDRVLDIVVIEDGLLEELVQRLASFFSLEQQPRRPEVDSWQARYPELLSAQITDIPGIHHVQARGVKIIPQGGLQEEVTLDGEIRGRTPMAVQIAAEQLCLIVPLLA